MNGLMVGRKNNKKQKNIFIVLVHFKGAAKCDSSADIDPFDVELDERRKARTENSFYGHFDQFYGHFNQLYGYLDYIYGHFDPFI